MFYWSIVRNIEISPGLEEGTVHYQDEKNRTSRLYYSGAKGLQGRGKINPKVREKAASCLEVVPRGR